jgi:hypothetical protein
VDPQKGITQIKKRYHTQKELFLPEQSNSTRENLRGTPDLLAQASLLNHKLKVKCKGLGT